MNTKSLKVVAFTLFFNLVGISASSASQPVASSQALGAFQARLNSICSSLSALEAQTQGASGVQDLLQECQSIRITAENAMPETSQLASKVNDNLGYLAYLADQAPTASERGERIRLVASILDLSNALATEVRVGLLSGRI